MKILIRSLSFLICALMILSVCACTSPNETPESTSAGTKTDAPKSTAADTTAEETGGAGSFSITVNGDKADVDTGSVKYTASGFNSASESGFSVSKDFSVVFKDSIKEKFNYITIEYSSGAAVKLYADYIEDSKEKTDMFYLEAAEKGSFSGLIESYLDRGHASELVSLKIDTCTGDETDFVLYGVKTEDREFITKSTYYLENSRYTVGIKLGWGGGINSIEDKKCKIKGLGNLINSHDTGRLVQQSYYGTAGNSEYEPGISFDVKWVYNPVQGGDQFGNASRLVDVKITDDSVYIKSQPQDWSLNGKITPSYMENTYTVYEDHIKVDNRFVDFSGWEHRFAGQELPAFYTVSYLSRFSWYNGDEPWQDKELTHKDDLKFWGTYASECTFPLKFGNTETWCAWTSPDSGYGIGLYVPGVDVFKAGRYEYNNSKSASDNATNYVAPVNTIKMISFKPIEYSYIISTGTLEDMRATFKANKDFTDNASLYTDHISSRVFGSVDKLIEGSFDTPESTAMLSSPNNSEISFSSEQNAVMITGTTDNGDPHVTVNYETGDAVDSAAYKTLTVEYMIPEDNAMNSYAADLFFCAGETSAPDGGKRVRQNLKKDGQYHTFEIDLSKLPYWTGSVHQIRFDYFDNCKAGDVMYLKTFKLS